MIFQRNLVLSTEVLSDIADDFIEVATKSKEKDKYRVTLLKNKMKDLVSNSTLLTVSDIERFTQQFRRSNLTTHQLMQLLKTVTNSLNEHYRALSTILRKW